MNSLKLKLIAFILTTSSALNGEVSECAQRIVNYYGGVRTILVSEEISLNSLNTSLSYLVVNLSGDLSYLQQLDEFSFYLIVTTEVDKVKKFFDGIYRTRNFNSRAKTLIIFEGKVTLISLFRLVMYFNLMDVVVIYQKKVYTYYPISEGRCEEVFVRYLGDCSRGLELSGMFNESASKYFERCSLRVLAFPVKPYIYGGSFEEDEGCDMVVVREISKSLKIDGRVINHNFTTEQLTTNEDNAYDKFMEMLFTKVGNAAIGAADFNEDYTSYDICNPSFVTYVSFYVPAARPVAAWQLLTYTFQIKALILFIFLFIISSVYYCLARTEGQTSYAKTFLFIYSILLNVAPKQPTTTKLRIIFIFFSFFSLIIITLVQSTLTAMLFLPAYESQITTVEELVDSDLRFGGTNLLKDTLIQAEALPKLAENFEETSGMNEYYLDRIINARDFAIASERRIVAAVALDKLKRLHVLPTSYVSLVGIYLDKGSPFTRRFNEVLQRLVENGMMDRLDVFGKSAEVLKADVQFKTLRLKQVQPAFALLLGGLVLASLIFFIEIAVKFLIKP